MTRHCKRTVAVAVLCLTACRDNVAISGPVAPPRTSATTDSTRARPRRDAEAHLVEIEREVPSFSGYYGDKSGVIHVLVTQRSQGERARAAVAAQFSAGRVPRRSRALPAIVVDSARFTFAQLAEWREVLLEHAAAGDLKQIRVLDLDEALNRVRMEVEGDVAPVWQAVAALNIDSAAIVIEPYTPLQYTRRRQSYPTTINSVASPVVGGIGIRWTGPFQEGGCTLGFIASAAGVKRFVTARNLSMILRHRVVGDY